MHFERLLLATMSFLITRVASYVVHQYKRSCSSLSPRLKILDVDGEKRELHTYDSGSTNDDSNPPLLIIGGTAQTIATYQGHLRDLTKSRRTILPELRCQGRLTELLHEHASIEQHAKDVIALLDTMSITKPLDVVGFSFGGRVALAVAAYNPHRIRKLSITGVPFRRTQLGSLILESWRSGLNQSPSELRSVAWSFILNGFSAQFIEQQADKLETFVEQIIVSNDTKKLASLMNESHIVDPAHRYSVQTCAARIICPTQVIGASEDRIAAPSTVKDLAAAIPTSNYLEMQACGHLAPFENPTAWRRSVIKFLDEV